MLEIGEIAARTRIRAVQLHGDETASDCADVRAMTGITVIKALRIAPDFHPDSALPYPADWLLVDAHGEEFGGSGRTADWQVASAVAAIVPRVMLAGGLKADNVALAIRTVRPCAVDVASGVEFAPGRKDAARLRAFFSAVAHAAKGEMD